MLDVAEITEQSPQMLREEYGLDFSATEVYYLDEDGYIRKTESAYHIRVEHEMLEEVLGTPVLDLEIQSESIVWDINEPIMVDFPAAEETVSFIGLMADPELADELGDGPLSELAELFQTFPAMEPMPIIDETQLLIDLERDIFLLSGEPLEMDVEPYLEEGTLMVPFRQIAELAEGEVGWDAVIRQVTYSDLEREMLITIGSETVLVNGEDIVLQQPAVIVQDRTMVPVELLEHLAQYHHYAEEGMALLVF